MLRDVLWLAALAGVAVGQPGYRLVAAPGQQELGRGGAGVRGMCR